MNSAPSIMVSSTFYDLRQIRADLAHFIADELGYVPLLSELPSFPIDPDLDTIENCRARVEKDANIFVLVIGGRYGSIDDKTNKSITNLEYLTARRKGIPIYTFVEKNILAVLPIWKNNPTADFSSTVDTTRLFEFIEYVQTQERVWTFPFETAQDITGMLRRQLGFLFSDSLRIRLRLSGGELPGYLDILGPEALRIALEKNEYWEYRLFFQCWIDEVNKRSDSIHEYYEGLTLETADFVKKVDAGIWLQTRVHELEGLTNSANKLINDSAIKAFGKPGIAGDQQKIIWVSKMLGSVLESMLHWATRIRCAKLEDPFEKLGKELSLFVDDLIYQFQTFPIDGLKRLEDAILKSSSETYQKIELTIVFQLSNLEEFDKELKKALSSIHLDI